MAAQRRPDDKVTLYVSWNEATEVASWQVLAGLAPEQLEPVGSPAPREGLETPSTVNTAEPRVAVQARNYSDRVLGTSTPIEE